MVRIGDTVVVDGEWGTVEEITLTFLTVRTWDERRITMPVSYFTSKPFENWSRGGVQMTGTVFFHLDHSAPVEEMREQAPRHPPRVPRLGRPRLRPRRHRHHPQHHRGARPGHREGRGRHLDGPRHRPRTDDPLADRPPPLRPAPRQHGRRGPPTGHPPERQRRPPPRTTRAERWNRRGRAGAEPRADEGAPRGAGNGALSPTNPHARTDISPHRKPAPSRRG